MMGTAGLVGGLVGLVLMALLFVLCLFVGAAVLRLACKICGVPQPSILKALGVVIVVGLATFIISLPIGLVVGFAGAAMGISVTALKIVANLIALPIVALVSAGLYMPLLKTSFGKGLLVWLAQLGIALAIGIAVAVVLLGVGLILRAL